MESKQSSFLVETLLKFGTLIIDFELSCPQAIDRKFRGPSFRLNTRWKQLNLILYRIEINIDQLTRDRNGVRDITSIDEIDILGAAPSLDIETFFVVVRSILEDMAIITPYFYPKGKKKPKAFSFNDQLKWYKSHPNFDPSMTDYINNNLGWFNELKDVRDGLVHKQCDIFPINAWSGKPDIPIGFSFINRYMDDMKIPYQPLEITLRTILQNLLRFLNFYSTHFKARLPNDWPCYKSRFSNPPKGSICGLSFLKHWSESPL